MSRWISTLAVASLIAAACGGDARDVPLDAAPPVPTEALTGVPVFPPADQLIARVESTPLARGPEGDTPVDSPPAELAAPAVARVKHVGPSERPTRIEITFDQPMQAFKGSRSVEDVGWLDVSPKLGGALSWSGAETLVFDPAEPFAVATRYQLTVSAKATAATGKPLAKPHVSIVETARPRVTYAPYGDVRYPASRDPKGLVTIQTNLPVTVKALKKALTVRRADSKAAMEANVTRAERVRIDAVDAKDGAAQRFNLTPTGGFGVNAYLRFEIGHELRAAAGGTLGPAKSRTFVVRGPTSLRVSYAECGYDACTTDTAWTVTFNNALASESVAGCFSAAPAIDLGKPTVDGSEVRFEPAGTEVGRTYKITANTRCKDVFGTSLTKPWEREFEIVAPPASLTMIHGAGYLEPAPRGEQLLVPVKARNAGTIEIRRRVVAAEGLSKFLADNLEEYGGFELADMSELEAIKVPPAADDGAREIPVRLDDVLTDGRGLVILEVTSSEPGAWGEPPVRRALVQVTDTGLSVKQSPQGALVWATSLATGEPLPNVTVRALQADGKELHVGKTDASGLARIPGHAALDGKTRVIVASAGEGDLSLLDLEDWSTRIEGYRFGLDTAWDPKADVLRAFVFTERGVYRAGEKVHIKGFARFDRGGALEALPEGEVDVQISDPTGELVGGGELKLGPVGDFDLELELDGEAAMGSYDIEVNVTGGKVEGTARGTFRVEAYRANRFEVKVSDVARDGDSVTGTAIGRYLYGAPMQGMSVTWWAHVSGTSFSPKGFSDYRFGTVSREYWWEPTDSSSQSVGSGSGELDKDGAFAITADLSDVDVSAGPKLVTLEAEVTDADEQVVSGRSKLRLHPGDFYLGVTRDGLIAEAKKPLNARLVAVTPEGTQLGDITVEVTLQRRTWKSVQKVTAGGGTSWVSEVHDELAGKTAVKSQAGAPALATFIPQSPGLYVIEARAKDGRDNEIVASERVWVWGKGNAYWSRSDDERIQLVMDKTTYKVGDTAKIMVQSPFGDAQALVTVERQGVITEQVVPVTGNAPLLEVPITADMQPNAYLSVVLVRDRDAELGAKGVGGDTSAYKIGYSSFTVDIADRELAVTIKPEQERYRPGETVRATLSLADDDGNPVRGQVTFMAVDEGVLSLTGYRTPNPVTAFYKHQPLSIVSSEARKRLWRRIEASEDGMKSDWGGGGEEGGEAVKYRSAFATTAAFLPRVEVDESGHAEVSFDLPDNLTAFRLMAVAATADNKFGRAETRIEVQKPLIVRPGLPRFLSSGDTFEARAIVQSVGSEGIGPVEVELTTSGPVEIDGPGMQLVKLELGQSKAVTFKAKALVPGEAIFAFKVRPAGTTTWEDAVQLPIPVQHPATIRTATEVGRVGDEHGVDDVAARRLDIPEWAREDVGGLEIELASSAMGELLPGLRYLLKYPYGCVEQTTGGTLPLLALSTLLGDFSLPGLRSDAVLTRAQAGLDRLRSMQIYNGGLSYWPGGNEAHPWGSAYAGMALVRGSQIEGLEVKGEVIDNLKGYLRQILTDKAKVETDWWRDELDVVKPYAAYVLALAGDPVPSYHSQMFDKRAELPAFGKALLALAVAEAGGDKVMIDTLVTDLLQDVEVSGAGALIKRQGDRHYYSTMDSDVRTSALVLMALMRARPDHKVIEQLARGLLAQRRDGHWGSTQDNGFAIIALAEYFNAREDASASYLATVRLGDEIWLQEKMQGGVLSPLRVRVPMAALKAKQGEVLTIKRDGDDAPLYYTMRFSYAPRDIPREAITRGFRIERSYEFAEGDKAGRPATSVEAGDIVKVTLTVETPETRRYVAIDDPLPAGLEPVDTTFETTGSRLGGHLDRGWRHRYAFTHIEQLDDRVNLFSNRMGAGKHTHTYLARATTSGSFIAPAARVHEMYAPNVYGESAALDVTVQ